MSNQVFVQNAHIDLYEVAKLESIDKLKELNIFSENADEANQTVWDAAQELKGQTSEPVKVEIKKHPKKKVAEG